MLLGCRTLPQFVPMSRRTCHFRGGVCRGYPTPTQSIAVSHVIIETGRPRGRGTEKENNNNKAVGQVFVLTLSGFFFSERGPKFGDPARTRRSGNFT